MAANPSTFSESWYRIAKQKISLRPSVRVRRQNFRGERWYVLENPFSNQFFRLRPAAYEFVARSVPIAPLRRSGPNASRGFRMTRRARRR